MVYTTLFGHEGHLCNCLSLPLMRALFCPEDTRTPVVEIIPVVKEYLQKEGNLIISAPPGAGKSTVLPLALLDEEWLSGEKIILLEPRRLAAATVARRMADLLGEPVGQTVGYRIRFETKVSAATRLEVVTEGILTRMLQEDNALEGVKLVIFDEFHERSLHADLALALCCEAQSVLRPDLRIMVMSATLEMQRLSERLNAPMVESKGRLFPIDTIYTGEQDLSRLTELCCMTILRALKEQEGDILVFLPGEGEIARCVTLLEGKTIAASIHPLYGRLPFSEQQAAILPAKDGRRKVVLSTAIAETSLTIEGIRVVVDSGFSRNLVFNAKTGLSSLSTLPLSLDSAAQRAGRAGRLGPGVCYRMWSKVNEQRMAEFRVPQLFEADLAPLLLDLAAWGVDDIDGMVWLDKPPAIALGIARDILNRLNALEGNRITAHGKKIHRLPCHPRIAHMLLLAQERGSLGLATDIAALLEERDPLEREGADFTLRVERLRTYRKNGRGDKRWATIENAAGIYRRLFGIKEDEGFVEETEVGVHLALTYPERVAMAKAGHPGQYFLANGHTAVIERSEVLSDQPFLAVAQLDARKGTGKIFSAAALNPRDLLTQAREQEVLVWDSRKGGLICRREWRWGSVLLDSTPLAHADPDAVIDVLLSAVRQEGEQLLDFNADFAGWQARMASLKEWRAEEEWPDISTHNLLRHAEDWITPWLTQVRKPEDFKKIPLVQAVQHFLPYDLQQRAALLAPSALDVPSGSKINIQYFLDGQAPVLSVRLQELFGMLDTPTVNEGRTKVVIHLLSPGFKPVQVTTDLRSFWNNTYFEVRKELKRRYPKHSWPENPLEAQAVRGVKRY